MLTDMQLDEGAIEEAVASFGCCLKECYNLGLWQSYMRYIKLVRSSQTFSLADKTKAPLARQPALCHRVGAPLAMCDEPRSCCRRMHQRGRQATSK